MTEETAIAVKEELYGYDLEQIKTIKSAIGFSMSDSDLRVFLHVCRHTKLCPIVRQIYAISRGGKMTIQTSIDGLRTIAERTGRYAPGRDTEFLYDAEGRLAGAKVFVKKLTADGTWHEVSSTALLCEYSTGQNLWKRLPHVMIEKCAESRALRRAFPSDTLGLYVEEEMDQAGLPPPPPSPKSKRSKDTIDAEVSEDLISDAEWEPLDAYINGHKEIRDTLTKLCKVTDLRHITKNQLEACRAYVRAQIKKQSDATADDTTNHSACELDTH